MKSVIITSSNFPFGGAGANYLRLFAKGLVENGFSVQVLLLKGYIYGNQRIKEDKTNDYERIQYIHCGFINRPFNIIGKIVDNFLGLFNSTLFIVKNADNNTLIFIYSNEIHLHLLSFIVAKIKNITIISFVPEGLDNKNRSTSFFSYLSWCSFFLNMNYFNPKSDKLIVFSNYLKNFYLSKGYNTHNIIVIPNLIDLDFFTPDVPSGYQTSKFRIGYCGNPSHKDGIEDLIVSFKIISSKDKDVELLIIGDSVNQNSVIDKIKKTLGDEHVLDNTIFTGLVSYKDVPGFLHSCNVLVLARPKGVQADAGFPTKLGEYLACKKPVVLTKVGDIPLYFDDKVNALLAEPDNPNSVADKILWVKNNPEKALIISECGYNWAKTNLDYRVAVNSLIKFLKGKDQ